jgi:sugar O-acyltransferase (sialic acid O-acetyltransferase NeuD family)
MKTAILIGAGGHASVVLEAARTMADLNVIGVVDADTDRHGGDLLGCPIIGGDDQMAGSGASYFIMGLGSVGNPGVRMAVYARAMLTGLKPLSVIHDRAWVSPTAKLGPGTVVLAQASVNAQAVVGANVILNTGCIVEHDAVIGDHAHIAPGAIVLGSTRVGGRTHIGAGAVIREGIIVGQEVLVAAGAVVVGDVADNVRIGGVPARNLDVRPDR